MGPIKWFVHRCRRSDQSPQTLRFGCAKVRREEGNEKKGRWEEKGKDEGRGIQSVAGHSRVLGHSANALKWPDASIRRRVCQFRCSAIQKLDASRDATFLLFSCNRSHTLRRCDRTCQVLSCCSVLQIWCQPEVIVFMSFKGSFDTRVRIYAHSKAGRLLPVATVRVSVQTTHYDLGNITHMHASADVWSREAWSVRVELILERLCGRVLIRLSSKSSK